MNHRPFEDWLLEDRPLGEQEQRELQMHLRECRSCSAIAESNLALHSVRWIAPPADFTARVTQRLARWRRMQRWYQMLGTLALVLGGLAVLYAFAGPAVQEALQSPADWITAATIYLVLAAESLQILTEVGRILVRALPSVMAPAGWMILMFGSAGLATIWAVAVRRLAHAPRGV